MKKDYFGISITAEFIVLILLSLIFFNRTEGKVSKAENRYLAVFPTLKESDGTISDSFNEELKTWFEENLGLRDAYLTLSGIINYNFLKRSKTERVEIGNNDYLYLADEGNLSLETSRSPDFKEKLPEYAKKIENVSNNLSERGIDYVFMVAPGKPSVYPEYIASSSHTVEDTLGDALCEYLSENSDINVIWSKEKLIKAKQNLDGQSVFLKTDTHWTVYGRNIAYRDIINRLNEWGYEDLSPVDVMFNKTDGAFYGDLSDMMGPVKLNGERLSEPDYVEWEPISINAREITSGEKYEKFQSLLIEKNIYNPELCNIYHNEKASQLNVLIFGDSMIRVCMIPELAETFSDLTFVWSYVPDEDIINLIEPDLVISEYGERQLNICLEDVDKGFVN